MLSAAIWFHQANSRLCDRIAKKLPLVCSARASTHAHIHLQLSTSQHSTLQLASVKVHPLQPIRTHWLGQGDKDRLRLRAALVRVLPERDLAGHAVPPTRDTRGTPLKATGVSTLESPSSSRRGSPPQTLERGVRASGYHPLAFTRLSAEVLSRQCRLTWNLVLLGKPRHGVIALKRAAQNTRTR